MAAKVVASPVKQTKPVIEKGEDRDVDAARESVIAAERNEAQKKAAKEQQEKKRREAEQKKREEEAKKRVDDEDDSQEVGKSHHGKAEKVQQTRGSSSEDEDDQLDKKGKSKKEREMSEDEDQEEEDRRPIGERIRERQLDDGEEDELINFLNGNISDDDEEVEEEEAEEDNSGKEEVQKKTKTKKKPSAQDSDYEPTTSASKKVRTFGCPPAPAHTHLTLSQYSAAVPVTTVTEKRARTSSRRRQARRARGPIRKRARPASDRRRRWPRRSSRPAKRRRASPKRSCAVRHPPPTPPHALLSADLFAIFSNKQQRDGSTSRGSKRPRWMCRPWPIVSSDALPYCATLRCTRPGLAHHRLTHSSVEIIIVILTDLSPSLPAGLCPGCLPTPSRLVLEVDSTCALPLPSPVLRRKPSRRRKRWRWRARPRRPTTSFLLRVMTKPLRKRRKRRRS